MSEIRVYLFDVDQEPQVRTIVGDHLAGIRALLRTEELAFYPMRWDGRWYHLVCVDNAVELDLPPHRVIRGPQDDGWPMCGPFLITRIEGDQDVSVHREDRAVLEAHLLPLARLDCPTCRRMACVERLCMTLSDAHMITCPHCSTAAPLARWGYPRDPLAGTNPV